MSLEEACNRYALNPDEISSWQQCIDRFGMVGLRTTRRQFYLKRSVEAGEFRLLLDFFLRRCHFTGRATNRLCCSWSVMLNFSIHSRHRERQRVPDRSVTEKLHHTTFGELRHILHNCRQFFSHNSRRHRGRHKARQSKGGAKLPFRSARGFGRRSGVACHGRTQLSA